MKKTLLVIASAVLLASAMPAHAQDRGAAQGRGGGQGRAAGPPDPNAKTSGPPADVMFYGNPRSAIANGVMIPANRAWLWVSGVGPSRINPQAQGREAYGDTKAQAQSILKNIAQQLSDHGLSMKDVVYLRAYVVPDPEKDNKMDMQGWSAAYGEVFGTAENPTKPARATIGVAALVGTGQLIEIEVVAVYPK